MKVVIVGGVAGGMSAATRLRRLDETAEIIVLDKGDYVSFANCGLPYYVSGEISERSDLLLNTPEGLKARFNLDVRVNNEVIAINRDARTVTVKTPTGEYEESYDKLLLSPGSSPVVPTIAGYQEARNVFTLRNVENLDALMNYLDHHQPKNAVVVGAGFIGLEMVENLKLKGLDVTLIEKSPHVLPPLDEEMAAYVSQELVKQGVDVRVNTSVVEILNDGQAVRLEDGTVLASDVIIMSVGVKPATDIAKKAGLALGMREGILVNDTYQTSDEHIYAVGDAIIVNNQLTNEEALISLASPANRQGRQVADVLAGKARQNKGSIGTAIVRVFDLSAASTGLTERQVKASGKPYHVVHTRGNDHAGYYPGATAITLKLIFNPETGELYGAQGVGAKGVDKRLDVLATAIKAGLTVEDLPELELTYAPPFGVAKDPVNMLGYVALNVMEGLTETVQWHEVPEKLATGMVLLDVRNEGELSKGRFPNSLNIPLNQLRERLDELDKQTTYIVSCASGQRSYLAERLLKQHGVKVKNLDGSFFLYSTVRPEELI
ncbi:FAD-dependent oxidoreductase [Vagococcus xieshaowenii]|uniref:CoA-disulfide reductase n=1 Tax=Vagococcus xieshaowenii TaxID=2562451 RepID=A0A4Z0D127_9ENTE|nr:FAD-dependent oxidoreductase [Vagococcus xieshaowenii]QCA27880.1 CoA-disulfide reductase [Vagococcus xieshaowenii]TFZ39441.1 CoA-disulfide reductase [Vagococcus xieshaowenii]